MNRNSLQILSAGAVALLLCAASATAATVIVEVQGEVWGKLINDGTLGEVEVGEDAVLIFAVDSDDFVDNPNNPTRGYAIDLESFQLAFSGGASIGLTPSFASPAYFVIRDNDPAVDGFFLSQGLDFQSALPLDQAGNLADFFGMRYLVTYEGDTLDSLDILDALGTYDFTGLTVFGMSVDDGPFLDALGMNFESMTLSVVGDITFDAVGHRVRGIHTVELSWDGASSAEVDIFRNGELIATVPNDGHHTDSTGNRGRKTYTYQICEAGTSVCSDEETVQFGGRPTSR